jgi:hypothetical protein
MATELPVRRRSEYLAPSRGLSRPGQDGNTAVVDPVAARTHPTSGGV